MTKRTEPPITVYASTGGTPELVRRIVRTNRGRGKSLPPGSTVVRADGTVLTEDDLDALSDQIAARGPGRPALDAALAGPSRPRTVRFGATIDEQLVAQSRREQRPVAEVVRDVVKRYLEAS